MSDRPRPGEAAPGKRIEVRRMTRRELNQHLLRTHPGARNYQCIGGPLDGKLLAGAPGWRIYVLRKGQGSREVLCWPVERPDLVDDVAVQQSSRVLGHYTVEEVRPGDVAWGWTDYGRQWGATWPPPMFSTVEQAAAAYLRTHPGARSFPMEGGPAAGRMHPGEPDHERVAHHQRRPSRLVISRVSGSRL